jgi:hypothetical protein
MAVDHVLHPDRAGLQPRGIVVAHGLIRKGLVGVVAEMDSVEELVGRGHLESQILIRVPETGVVGAQLYPAGVGLGIPGLRAVRLSQPEGVAQVADQIDVVATVPPFGVPVIRGWRFEPYGVNLV